ncbi:MAG: hypothetical protein H6727_08560 [Myxococcales bacterium]|nr:hypothetical protein [Myxococcales bacterium]
MKNIRVLWVVWGFFLGIPWASAEKTTQVRPSRSFVRTAEYTHFTQLSNQTEQPWQREKQRCGWDLHVHLRRQGQASFRYGPYYRGFVMPLSASQDAAVRARTLLLLLGLFWDAAQQELQAGSLSCKPRKTRVLEVALPGTLQAPPPRRKKRKRVAVVRPRPRPRPVVETPRPRPRPTSRPISRPVARVVIPPPRRVKRRPPPKAKPQPVPLDFTLGGQFSPYFSFNGRFIWGGGISTLYWARNPWRLRIEATGARAGDPTLGGQIIAQLAAFAEWVPWRSRWFSVDVHLGLNVIFSWSFNDAGSYLWLTPGVQGGGTFSWHPFERLTLFFRMDVAYFPFLSPAKDDNSYIHLQDLHLVPMLGFTWRL